MPINKKLEKQFIVYSYDRTPHSKKGIDTHNMEKSHYVEKTTKKRAYDSIYIEFRNKHNLWL